MPEIEGSAVFVGPFEMVATTADASEVTVVAPPLFVAMTMPRIVLPTSAAASVIAVVVMTAEASAQLLPATSQRCHL